ncbi:unnamed protein product [Rotaria sordida]|uniref:Cadherin domain-containing protein n=1 Tax=Rotaria sordida TaxID=392033 RepID=A0A816D0V8_9BILA|nr:unnamed protein product [Rotaria sordida]CAF1381949.1 unnamed protein product [Rotaria sordida]CAF1409984.1 unnamed protein product [Rotaria sordida]CAF1479200.1 unnamed protein product [Rotaria sordida]CAF1628243.1 unnamed protein product [Rotaria sordida]
MIIIYIFLLNIHSILTISIDIRYPQFFHQSLYDSSIEITEGKAIGSFIAFINLINDTNINLNEWLLNTTNQDFKIQFNDLSYSLITTQILDRERINFYNFSINAQHLILPYEKISKNIRIRILDINDCIPTFNQTLYQTTIIPNETNFTIQAYDCDEPNTDNSRITYTLSNYQDLFYINQTTGLIQCIKNLYTYENYEIIIVARDHGKPSLSSTILVQIQLISSIKNQQLNKYLWLNIKKNSNNLSLLLLLLLFIFLIICFIFICLLIYCINKKKVQKCKKENFHEKKFSSTSTINSLNDFQQTIVYDAVNLFPNTYYLPVEKQQKDFNENLNHTNNNNDISLDRQQSLSTTSSPISTNDNGIKISSDDGCYCSSDMSSEQSNNNNILLLNPSSLTLLTNSKLSTKQVRFNENNSNNIDRILKRFENLYDSQTNTDHCASYV